MKDKIAKKILKMEKDKLMSKSKFDRDWELITALDLAIKALERDAKVDYITDHWNDVRHNFVAACEAFEYILKVYGRGISEDVEND